MQPKTIFAKIDINGEFYQLNHTGVLKKRYCPFVKNTMVCGDWCSHFQVYIKGDLAQFRHIELCHGKVIQVHKEEFQIEKKETTENA